MRRVLLIFVAVWGVLSPVASRAQPIPCIDPSQSWAWSYNNDPIQSIQYYLDTQLLAVYYRSTIMHIATKVPLNVAQRFQQLGYGVSPDSTWNAMRGSYLEALQAQNHCPLLAQNGAYLLSAPSRQDIAN